MVGLVLIATLTFLTSMMSSITKSMGIGGDEPSTAPSPPPASTTPTVPATLAALPPSASGSTDTSAPLPWWALGVGVVAAIVLALAVWVAVVVVRRIRRARAERAAVEELYGQARTIRQVLLDEYGAFELSLVQTVLYRPLLADTSAPLTAKFHRARIAMDDAFVLARGRELQRVRDALTASRDARAAWDTASAAAVKAGAQSYGTFDQRRVERARDLLTRAASPSVGAYERDTSIQRAADILAKLNHTSADHERARIAEQFEAVEKRRLAIESPTRKALPSGAST
ncbi:hypothetical protein AXK58_13835 [Tsukamurella tyrosinosolvens]|nr:hypothetical protein AXK58_13835 [Tsukamurella tyrosinosolvens]